MSDSASIRSFCDVDEGENVVVEWDDGHCDRLGRVERVLSATDLEGEEHIVYLSRGQLHCTHYLGSEPKEYHDVMGRARIALASPWPLLRKRQQEQLEDQVGAAVSLALCNRIVEARHVLDGALAFARGECLRMLSSWHLGAGALTALLLATLSWFLGPVRDGPPEGSLQALGFLLGIAFFAGPVGGLLALTRPRKQAVDLSPQVNAWKAALTGILQIFVSVATALVVLLAVRVGIAASTLLESEPMAGYVLAAIAGGFGSKWATSILSTVSAARGEVGAEDGRESPPAPDS